MILQALCGYYDRLASDPNLDVAAEGYAATNVVACIILNAEGDLVGVMDMRQNAGKKLRPRTLANVPIQPKRSGSKPEAAFLCENAAFLFGIHDKPDAALYRFEASREKHEQILGSVDDVGAEALLRFFAKRRQGSYEYSYQGQPIDTSPLNQAGNIVFRLDTENTFLHQRPAIRAAWESYYTAKDAQAPQGQCLVTGQVAPIARLHNGMIGFADRATLVGFNQNAFESYGKKQGDNAPVSQIAAFQYVTALNSLIADPRHSTMLHGDRIVFWAERNNPVEEDLTALMFSGNDAPEANPENPQRDEAYNERIKTTLEALLRGKSPRELGLEPDLVFYVLGFSANKTRLVIRFFYRNTFGDLLSKFRQHYQDIEIVHSQVPPTLFRLLRETAVQRKSENVPAPLRTALMRSILEGGRYPVSLYMAMLQRIRAEAGSDAYRAINALRIGVIKGYLNRNVRLSGQNSEGGLMTVALNPQETNQGYILGRLFALLERAQYDALGQLNASIVDKYLNAALATPQSVFPHLLSLAEKHFSKSEKYYVKKLVGDVMLLLPSSGFPNILSAEDQGRFMIGYYHQKYTYLDDRETRNDSDNENGGSENV